MTLDKLELNKNAVVTKVNGKGNLRNHLLDMGVTPKTIVKVVKKAPLGDPIELLIRGYSLTIRLDDAKMIEIEDEI